MLSLYRRHLKKCPHASSGVRYAGFIRNDRAHAVSGPFQWRAQLARPRKIGFVRSKRVTVWQQRDKTRYKYSLLFQCRVLECLVP